MDREQRTRARAKAGLLPRVDRSRMLGGTCGESCACAGCREDIQAGETCIEAIAAQSIRLWFHPGCGIALASVQGWEPYD
ncbi:MAG TPA: hypothetical protein VFA75_02210 [Nevskia sp.]|nr:hypothetical protein [Nevskia sp.]